MNRELQVIVDNGFEIEIRSTIKHELLGEYSYVEISEYVRYFKHDAGFIPDKMLKNSYCSKLRHGKLRHGPE